MKIIIFLILLCFSSSLLSETFKITKNKNTADFIFTAKNLNINLDVTVGIASYKTFLRFTDQDMIIGINKSNCVLNNLDAINIFVNNSYNNNSLNFMIIPLGYNPDFTMHIDYNNQHQSDFDICISGYVTKNQIEEYAAAAAILSKCISNYKRNIYLIENLNLDKSPEDDLHHFYCYKLLDFLKSNY